MKQNKKVSKEVMRLNNLQLIFETVYRNKGETRAHLAQITKMSAMAVGRIADILLNYGLLTESAPENAKGFADKRANDIGRPPTRLYISAKHPDVGVSLDPGGVFIALIEPYGEIIKEYEHRFSPSSMQPREALDVVGRAIEAFVKEHNVDPSRTVGIVIPGLIDCARGYVRFSSQLRWRDVPVAEMLSSRVKSVCIDNDIKARVQAESRFGAAKGYSSSVLLNIGSGVGAGIVIDNEIYRGSNNLAGEIGHTALGINNRMCECGRKGCLEANISLPAVIREANLVRPGIGIDGLEMAANDGETWAKTLIGMTAEHVFMVIDLLANSYAPEVIVLSGSLIDKCAALRSGIEAIYGERSAFMLNNSCGLRFSHFGPDGNVIAAAALAFNHNVKRVIEGNEKQTLPEG